MNTLAAGFLFLASLAPLSAVVQEAAVCDEGWDMIPGIQNEGQDHPTCLLWTGMKADFNGASRYCRSIYAQLPAPQDYDQVAALEAYAASKNGSDDFGFWSAYKRRALSLDHFSPYMPRLRNARTDKSLYHNIYQLCKPADGEVWRCGQPDDRAGYEAPHTADEACVARRALKLEGKGLDDTVCSAVHHVICSRCAPDPREKDMPY